MTRVKICGIRELPHALAALRAGADLLGFVFYRPSHRYVDPGSVCELVRRAREECGRDWTAVGLFVNERPAFVEQVTRECGLDLAQLSGDEDRDYCRQLRVPFIKVVRPGSVPLETLERFSRARFWGAERVLLDAHVAGRYGGTGQALDWAVVRELASECLLAGGLHPGNVEDAIEAARPWGVDVSSGVEIDRCKDVALIEAFVDRVRRADRRLGVTLET